MVKNTCFKSEGWLCADLRSSHLGENLDHPIGTFGTQFLHALHVSVAGIRGVRSRATWGAQKAREIFTDAGFKVEG